MPTATNIIDHLDTLSADDLVLEENMLYFSGDGSVKAELEPWDPEPKEGRLAVADLDASVLRSACGAILRSMRDDAKDLDGIVFRSGSSLRYHSVEMPVPDALRMLGGEPSGDPSEDACLAIGAVAAYGNLCGRLGSGCYSLLQLVRCGGPDNTIMLCSPCICEMVAAILRKRAEAEA